MWSVIEKHLKEKNITAYRLAKMTGLTQQTISAMKTGKIKDPRFKIIIRISNVLDIDLNEFKEKEK